MIITNTVLCCAPVCPSIFQCHTGDVHVANHIACRCHEVTDFHTCTADHWNTINCPAKSWWWAASCGTAEGGSLTHLGIFCL